MPSLVLDYDESVGIKSAIKILGGRWNKAETVELLKIARHSQPLPYGPPNLLRGARRLRGLQKVYKAFAEAAGTGSNSKRFQIFTRALHRHSKIFPSKQRQGKGRANSAYFDSGHEHGYD